MNEPQPTLQQRIDASPELQRAQQEALDLNLLWDNLQRPISERICRHQIALDSIRHLRNAHKSSTYIKRVWNQMWHSY